MKGDNKQIKHADLLQQNWFSLKEACRIKGVNYKTVLNTPWRKPNCGRYDAIMNSKKMYSRQTIDKWLDQTDDMLIKQFQKMQEEKNG